MINRLVSSALLGIMMTAGTVTPSHAQSPASQRDGVERAALDYIEGFYEGDTAKLVRSIRPEVYKYGFSYSKAAKAYRGEPMSWAKIIAYAKSVKASGKPTPASAPKQVDILEVLDQTAAAKVTAWWGTDYVLMGRFNGTWMITHVLWQSPPPKEM